MTHSPRFSSGTNNRSRSFGAAATIRSALPLVTITSHNAFTAALQLMYAIVQKFGFVACNAANLGAGQLSSSEQPAFLSGSTTILFGFKIFAVSAMKCTPQNTMTSAFVLAACCDNPSESPT